MTAVERLRALLSKATPGPWVKPFEDGAISTAAAPHVSLLALDRDDTAIVDKPSDAALIVAMRNSYESLLDVAEAAQRVNAVSAEATKAYPDAENLRLFYVALSDLHDALAKLSEIENGQSSTETNVHGGDK